MKKIVYLVLASSVCACQPPLPSNCEMISGGYCELVNEEFENKIQKTKINNFPNLETKIIYWDENSTFRFPEVVSLPFVYIKKDSGVWIRYKTYPDVDFFLSEDLTDGYIYKEAVLDEYAVKKHKKWYVSLSKNDEEVYHQVIHTYVRPIYGTDLGSYYEYPNFHKIRGKLKALQEKLIELPDNKYEKHHFWYKEDQKNISFSGKTVCPPIKDATFEWKNSKNKQRVQFKHNPEDVFWGICGKEYNIVLRHIPIKNVHCNKERDNQFNFQLIENKPFTIPERFIQDHTNMHNDYQLKEGYVLSDVVSYEFNNRYFILNDEKKPEKEWRYELKLFNKNNEVISEECTSAYHTWTEIDPKKPETHIVKKIEKTQKIYSPVYHF